MDARKFLKKLFENFQQLVFIVQTHEKSTRVFLIFLKNLLKYLFLQFS
ncbi:MAG: hypothetical protein FD143_3010 [Ignavibacteria bacterium]|nr:MAG: hypothetical protein FD143_3010 [Ignavibacteria bacterium]